MKRWAHEAVDAIIAGDPEPALPGAGAHVQRYNVDNGTVTKHTRPGDVLRNIADPVTGSGSIMEVAR